MFAHSSIMGHITHPLMLYAFIIYVICVKLLCRFWDAAIYRIKCLLSKIKNNNKQTMED